MKFRTASRDSPEINLTALIDVIFLLLIFFMVSTTFELHTDLSVELPEASARAKARDERVIEVVIDAGGAVRVGDRPLAAPEVGVLRRALVQAAQGLDAPPVVISADAQASHQSVVTVMDAARQAGLYKLTFAARRPEEAGH